MVPKSYMVNMSQSEQVRKAQIIWCARRGPCRTFGLFPHTRDAADFLTPQNAVWLQLGPHILLRIWPGYYMGRHRRYN